MVRLPLITNSECTSYRRCAREHHYAYTLGVRPVAVEGALGFGTGVHAALELRWGGLGALAVDGDFSDAYEWEKALAMLDGYDLRWHDDLERYEVLGVEQQFAAPLVNPTTGHASTAYQLGGKLDVLVRERRTGDVWIVEHKTSSQDITQGSTYWARLRLDSQVSTYMVGARALGLEPRGVIYDVLKKPALKPLKATANVKLKKDGTPYAGQRTADETPAEYGARCREAIAADPDAYYQRGEIVRLVDEDREAAADTWHIAARIRESRRDGVAPRNPDACSRYGRMCAYFGVCSRESSLDDVTKFRKVDQVHLELAIEEAAQ